MSTVGRNTQGVILIRTMEDEKVVGLQRIEEIEVEDLPEGEVVDVPEADETADLALRNNSEK